MFLFRAPALVEVDEIPFCVRGQLFGVNCTCQLDRYPDLLQIGRAVGASSKVRLESAPLSP
jgi:hypothetical protein